MSQTNNKVLRLTRFIGYVPDDKIPIYIEYVEKGKHPEGDFHDHDFSEIVVVLSGHAKHVIRNSFEEISTGDILFLHPGCQHAYYDTGDMEIVNLTYSAAKLPIPYFDAWDLPLFESLFSVPAESDNSPGSAKPLMKLEKNTLNEIALLIRRLAAELESGKSGSYFTSMGIFMEIISILCRNGMALPSPVKWEFKLSETVQYINRHFREHLEIKELARMSCMSERNFYRYFHELLGCSPHEYMIRRRIHESMTMLSKTDKSIYEIANECGFCDGNHFTKTFRKLKGISPCKYRSQERKNMGEKQK